MKRVLFGLVLVAAGGAWACSSDDNGKAASPTPPPPPQQGGELGIAEFKYKCLLSSDPQCDFDSELGTGSGSGSSDQLPDIAMNTTFGLDLSYIQDAGAGAPPALTALHPDFLTVGADGSIMPIKPGKSTLGLNRGGQVVDLVDINAVDATLKLFAADPKGNFTSVQVSSDGTVKATGTFTFRFRAALVDKTRVAEAAPPVLAGSLPCKWTIVGDPAIANFPANTDVTDNIITVVTGQKNGEITLHLDYGTFQADTKISVGS